MVLSFLAPAWAAPGQTDDAPPAESTNVVGRLDSPRDTILTFRRLVERRLDGGFTADPIIENRLAEVMGMQGVLARGSVSKRAERLYYVLNRLGDPDEWLRVVPDAEQVERRDIVDWSLVPNPSLNRHHHDLLSIAPDASIGLIRDENGHWLFEQRTIDDIIDLHRRVMSLPVAEGLRDEKTGSLALRLERMIPRWLAGGGFAGMPNWQLAALVLVVFLGLAADLVFQTFLRGIWRRFAKRRGTKVDQEKLTKTVRPFGRSVQALVWYLGVSLLSVPEPGQTILLAIAQLVMSVMFAWASWYLTDLLGDLMLRQAQKTRSRIDDLLVPLIRKTMKIAVVILGVVYAASSLNIPVVPLLGGLGVGGIAVAFAAKDTIENLFGSIAVVLDRPFEVGDWIVIDEVEGNVEELGLRSTRIRTFYNSQISVPNASLVRAKVDNYGRRRMRRFKSTIHVGPGSTPEQLEALCEGMRELVRHHPYTRKDNYHIWVNDWQPQSLGVMVYIFFETPDWATELRERHRFILDTHRLAQRLGVETAPPDRTALMREPARAAEGDEPVERSAERAARQHGLQTARTMTSEASWNEARPSPVIFTAPEDND